MISRRKVLSPDLVYNLIHILTIPPYNPIPQTPSSTVSGILFLTYPAGDGRRALLLRLIGDPPTHATVSCGTCHSNCCWSLLIEESRSYSRLTPCASLTGIQKHTQPVLLDAAFFLS